MRIESLDERLQNGRKRVSATIHWEDCDRPSREIYFESPVDAADGLHVNPNAFVTGAIVPAMHHGERRVRIEGSVCPELRDGIDSNLQVLRHWHKGNQYRQVAIEPSGGFAAPVPTPGRHHASFMSGGVDALATLRENRLSYPLDHPGSIKSCLHVHGFVFGGVEEEDPMLESFEYGAETLRQLGRVENFTLIPVYTNFRFLEDGLNFFTLVYFGAFLSAAAHAFSGRISLARIASSTPAWDSMALGSHPVLDSNYRSADLTIVHDGNHLGRLGKVDLISQWPAGLDALSSCGNTLRPRGLQNCGHCEKCIRTMAELLVMGKLKACKAFEADDVVAEMIESFHVALVPDDPDRDPSLQPPAYITYANLPYWLELIEPLESLGREDLVAAIRKLNQDYEKRQRFEQSPERIRRLRSRLLDFDRRYLSGSLRYLYRMLKER